MTKKETRVIRKAEYMIPYHMARCPNYGWKESPEYARAEELKDKIGAIEAKAKKRKVTKSGINRSIGSVSLEVSYPQACEGLAWLGTLNFPLKGSEGSPCA